MSANLVGLFDIASEVCDEEEMKDYYFFPVWKLELPLEFF